MGRCTLDVPTVCVSLLKSLFVIFYRISSMTKGGFCFPLIRLTPFWLNCIILLEKMDFLKGVYSLGIVGFSALLEIFFNFLFLLIKLFCNFDQSGVLLFHFEKAVVLGKILLRGTYFFNVLVGICSCN